MAFRLFRARASYGIASIPTASQALAFVYTLSGEQRAELHWRLAERCLEAFETALISEDIAEMAFENALITDNLLID